MNCAVVRPPPTTHGNIIPLPLEEQSKPGLKSVQQPILFGLLAVPVELQSPVLAARMMRAAAQTSEDPKSHQFTFNISVGETAEVLVGRLAMVGGVGVFLVRVLTGQGLIQQAMCFPANVLLICLLVTVCSVSKCSSQIELKVQLVPLFFQSEKRWGRLAMAAFGVAFLWEWVLMM